MYRMLMYILCDTSHDLEYFKVHCTINGEEKTGGSTTLQFNQIKSDIKSTCCVYDLILISGDLHIFNHQQSRDRKSYTDS